MLCAVRVLDGSNENVPLAKRAKGRCLLKEVCRRLKLTPEIDYFGLRITDHSGQERWLNLRNTIKSQMSKCNIYRLDLRVKYYVKLSQIFLEETRHQFFLNVKLNLNEGKYLLSRDKYPRIAAILLRSEHGEDALSAISSYPIILRDWNPQVDTEALAKLRAEHAQLTGVTKLDAKILLLTEMERFEQTYGAELFPAINCLEDDVIIAVCKDAVRIFGNDKALIDEYRYTTGLFPTNKGKHFYFEIEENYSCYKMKYELPSRSAARSLHRATVEFCTFFTHEIVSDWVRDSKRQVNGLKIVSALIRRNKENQPKTYNFDIIRTVNEVSEHAWRLVAEERARTVQSKWGLHTPKLNDQRVFKFGPDTPIPSTPTHFDFSHPAFRLRLRSGYLTDDHLTVPSVEKFFPPITCFKPKTPTITPSITKSVSRTSQGGNSLLTPHLTAKTSMDEMVAKLKQSPLVHQGKKAFQDKFYCKICKKEFKNCAFVPCRHVVACWSCALSCDECCECNCKVESVTPVRYP